METQNDSISDVFFFTNDIFFYHENPYQKYILKLFCTFSHDFIEKLSHFCKIYCVASIIWRPGGMEKNNYNKDKTNLKTRLERFHKKKERKIFQKEINLERATKIVQQT